MKHLVIVGGGPRGIGLALYATHRGLRVTLIDPSPVQSWSPTKIVSDIVMRSPLSFDLVTSLPCLREYSLYSFLLGADKIFNTQKELESDTSSLDRNQFFDYLNFIWSKLDITHIPDTLEFCREKEAVTRSGKIIPFDSIAFCVGNAGYKNSPHYCVSGNLLSKIIPNEDLVNLTITNSKIAVLGSGQGAAEAVDYFIDKGNFVYWITKDHKVNRYPIPSCTEWGTRSALGPFYSRIVRQEQRTQYLKEVKAWTPSITPYINDRLTDKRGSFISLNPNLFNVTNKLEEVDNIFVSAGIRTSVQVLSNIFCYKLPLNSFNTNFPDIVSNFRVKNSNIYFSGSLASYFDGPRQGSVISVGNTSKTIVEDILNG